MLMHIRNMWLFIKNAFCTLHRQTCLEVVSKLLGTRPAWFQAVSNLLTRPAHLLSPGDGEPFSTYDGIPQGDPMSTLLFATTMSTVVRQVIAAVPASVSRLSYIYDTVLVDPPDKVASVLQELPNLLAHTGLQLQPAKTKLWSPTPGAVASHPPAQDPPGHHVRHSWPYYLGGNCGSDPKMPVRLGMTPTSLTTCNRTQKGWSKTLGSYATCLACVVMTKPASRLHGHCFRGKSPHALCTCSEHIRCILLQ